MMNERLVSAEVEPRLVQESRPRLRPRPHSGARTTRSKVGPLDLQPSRSTCAGFSSSQVAIRWTRRWPGPRVLKIRHHVGGHRLPPLPFLAREAPQEVALEGAGIRLDTAGFEPADVEHSRQGGGSSSPMRTGGP